MTGDREVVLILSGGNALGAFQAGVYEAMHDNGLRPGWIVGTSIGAINASLIAGSPDEHRIRNLRAFWRPDVIGPLDAAHPWLWTDMETSRRTGAAAWTVLAGKSGIFGPILSGHGLWTDGRPSIYQTDRLARALERMVDFDRVNEGECRVTVTAVDVSSGEDVAFDTEECRIGSRHIQASAALPVLFPPVEIDGRWLVDGGVSANLPLDPVLERPPGRPALCIAVDLLPLSGDRPRSLGEAAERMQDLMFASQSRRSIERWQATYRGYDNHSIALVRLPYHEQDDEIAGKALDFSGPTLSKRWAAGHRAGLRLVQAINEERGAFDKPGLTVRVVT